MVPEAVLEPAHIFVTPEMNRGLCRESTYGRNEREELFASSESEYF